MSKTTQKDATGSHVHTPLYKERVVRAIRRIIRSVDIYSQKLALESGVTAPQLSCLIRVVEAGPMTLKSLAAAVDLSASTTVGIVDRLEKKGLVQRERSRIDRRQVFIAATEAGEILAEGSPSPLQDRLAAALDALPELERAAITLSLERIVELMEIGDVSAGQILDTGISLQADIPQIEQGSRWTERLEGAASSLVMPADPKPAHE
ncbi:MAG: MarR family transcriptional regulator [Acidobacteria bacterium]|nr:MarR family transcriptional regulator [Acidobacteriota bacterium]